MKLLIIHAAETSSWGSCKVISPNLQKTYKALGEKFELSWFQMPTRYIHDELQTSSSHILDLSQRIKKEKPDKLVFIDHLPNPAEILNNLSLIMDLNQLPEILIHMYGDFTYFSKDWLEVAPKLVNHSIKFLTASASQKKLLSFFCEDTSLVDQFCFPVNSEEYFFDSDARRRLREEKQIGEQDIILLYAGRISLQKNCDILIKEYLKLNRSFGSTIHLWMVGAFDDLGAPFMGADTQEGYLYSKIEGILSNLPDEFKSKIKFWGIQDTQTLREIKSAADVFISLSLYHDEDYGMSPAEALACGLPTLLTDWGGYSSFASKSWRCQLMPVSITEYGLKIKTSAIHDFLKNYFECYVADVDRTRWSKEFLEQFSIIQASKKLGEHINNKFKPFKGFNWAIAPLAHTYGKYSGKKSIDIQASPSDKNFYFQVYKNYISQNESEDPSARYETIQWAYDFIRSSEIDYVSETRKKSKSYHVYLSPFSRKYYSTMAPALVFNGKLSSKLFDKNIVTLRDGIVPLSLFFEDQSPAKFSGNIAIHKDLWFLVPKIWQDKTYFYEIKGEVSFSKTQLPEKIFLAGTLNSTFADPQEFELALLQLQKTLGKENIQKMDILAFFPLNKKVNLWGKWQDDELLKITRHLYDNLKINIKFSDWQSIRSETNFRNTLYYEINSGYFIKDTYTRHFALSRGAGELAQTSTLASLEQIKIQKLSLYHSMNVYKPDFSKLPAYVNPLDNDYHDLFKSIYMSNKAPGLSTSWDSCFTSYLKKYFNLFPPRLL
ncbi:MAG: glycosyltransferase family 4 protein [Bacteriovorax sp.]|jgi:hypothetical protein